MGIAAKSLHRLTMRFSGLRHRGRVSSGLARYRILGGVAGGSVAVLLVGTTLLLSQDAVLSAGLGRERRIDLSHYTLAFEDRFHNLDVSSNGPGTRWTAHTPWHGDFGDARFTDPQPGFPFTTSSQGLRIELRKAPDGWRSGLLASTGEDGTGFAMRYGYFEVSAKFPEGDGLWPAFWLDSVVPAGSADPSLEVDVVEHYGRFPAAFNSTMTVWPHTAAMTKQSWSFIRDVPAGSLASAFHSYGVDVEPDWTVFYFDRIEYWRLATPRTHRHKLTMLLDLGLGGGWPIDAAPSPSFMHVAAVRAYRSPANDAPLGLVP